MNPNLNTFDDSDLWQMASEAALDRPTDPMQDDMESAKSLYHRKMAEFQLTHQAAKEEAFENRQCYAFVMINGRACDPELDLRLSELEGYKIQAMQHMKTILHCQMAAILVHYLSPDAHLLSEDHLARGGGREAQGVLAQERRAEAEAGA